MAIAGARVRNTNRSQVLSGVTAVVVVWSLLGMAATAAAGEAACPADRVPEDGFTDVTDANVHEAAVDCVVWWRIAGGTSTTAFTPLAKVSRAQIATMMVRVVEHAGGELADTPPNAFTDDEGSPHEPSINRLAAAGLISGTAPGEFSPHASIRRAQLASMLVRVHEYVTGAGLPAGEDRFTDDTGDAHEGNINRAAAAGLVGGTSATTFDPAGAVRRDQLGSAVVRQLEALVVGGQITTLPDGSGSGSGEAPPPPQEPPPTAPTSCQIDAAAWCATYFDNATLSGTPVYADRPATATKDWAANAPAAGVPADNHSIRFVRDWSFEAGRYRFVARADDGVRVKVDGTTVIDRFGSYASQTFTQDIDLTAGSHRVTVEFVEYTGAANLMVDWSKVAVDRLAPDKSLEGGQQLVSANGAYRMPMQGDGNFVLYKGSTVLWASGTDGNSGARVVMQGDGNLVIYAAGGRVLWASGTDGNAGASFVLQNDGNAVLYAAGGRVLWATNTTQGGGGGTPPPTGQYSPPVWWPLRGSNLVGCTRNSTGAVCEGDYHPVWAIDIEGPEGQEVYAAGSGLAKVHTDTTGCSGYGRAVVVDHGGGAKSLYAHLSRFSDDIAANPGGVWVNANSVIGYMGHTGNTSRCAYNHLHYEETTNGSFWGSATDPGPANACVDGRLVTYPNEWGRTSWNGLPGHTYRARNDGTQCG